MPKVDEMIRGVNEGLTRIREIDAELEVISQVVENLCLLAEKVKTYEKAIEGFADFLIRENLVNRLHDYIAARSAEIKPKLN